MDQLSTEIHIFRLVLQLFSDLYGIMNFLKLSFVMEVVAGLQNCPVNAVILEIFCYMYYIY